MQNSVDSGLANGIRAPCLRPKLKAPEARLSADAIRNEAAADASAIATAGSSGSARAEAA
jgi:hypothetical protein